jgi:hypothetical protein
MCEVGQQIIKLMVVPNSEHYEKNFGTEGHQNEKAIRRYFRLPLGIVFNNAAENINIK